MDWIVKRVWNQLYKLRNVVTDQLVLRQWAVTVFPDSRGYSSTPRRNLACGDFVKPSCYVKPEATAMNFSITENNSGRSGLKKLTDCATLWRHSRVG